MKKKSKEIKIKKVRHYAMIKVSCVAGSQTEAFKLFEQVKLPEGVTTEGVSFSEKVI